MKQFRLLFGCLAGLVGVLLAPPAWFDGPATWLDSHLTVIAAIGTVCSVFVVVGEITVKGLIELRKPPQVSHTPTAPDRVA